MICYRDKTYCSSPNCKNECGRKFTEQDKLSATIWWGSDDFPLALSEFCNKEGNLINE